MNIENRAHSLSPYVPLLFLLCVLLLSLPRFSFAFARLTSSVFVSFPLSCFLAPFPLCLLSFCWFISVATFIFLFFSCKIRLAACGVLSFRFFFLWVLLRCASRVFVSTLPVRLRPLFLALVFFFIYLLLLRRIAYLFVSSLFLRTHAHTHTTLYLRPFHP